METSPVEGSGQLFLFDPGQMRFAEIVSSGTTYWAASCLCKKSGVLELEWVMEYVIEDWKFTWIVSLEKKKER